MWWLRSLRGRLIIAVSLTMVATQLIVIWGASRDLLRLEQAQRHSMAAQFIASAVARSDKVPEDVRSRLYSSGAVRRPPPRGTPPDKPSFDRQPPPDKPFFEKRAPPPGGMGPSKSSRGPDPWRVQLAVEKSPEIPAADEASAVFESTLRELLPELERVIYREEPGVFWFTRGRSYSVKAWMRLPDGQYLVAEMRDPGKPPDDFEKNPYADLLVRALIGIALALLITHWVVKPLSTLAAAADAIAGDGNAARPILVQGPTEIASTLAAFERMRQRIHGMIQQRTTMLTALAHDLRTPITRLMLRLEMTSDEALKTKAVRDCEKMQTLITSTLDYIRSLDAAPMDETVSLKSTVHAALSGLGVTEQVPVQGEDATVRGSRWNLERSIANLVDNAVKHGGSAEVSIRTEGRQAVLAVRDHGPGVPENMLARLREPFFRVDEARGVDSGGAGLGLSIVDNLVGAVGGTMKIHNHPEGGLCIELWLPAA